MRITLLLSSLSLTALAACTAPATAPPAPPAAAVSTAPASLQLLVSSRTGGDQRMDVAAIVLDVARRPVPGVAVTFSVSNGTLTTNPVTTDDTGYARSIASANWNNTIMASAAGFSQSSKVTGVAPPPLSVSIGAPSSAEEDETISFSMMAYGNDGAVSVVRWNFGDGTVLNGNQLTPSHRYGSDGNYTVTVDVVDASGRTASGTKHVNVFPAPSTPTPTPPPGLVLTVTCSKNTPLNATCPIQARYQNGDINSRIVSATWNWGDATTTTNVGAPASPTASHTFPAAGTYTVSVTVTLNTGETITGTTTVTAG